MQLDILDEQGTSYLYNNVAHIPRVGEWVDIYPSNERAAHRLTCGTVRHVSWIYISGESEYTVTVHIHNQPDPTRNVEGEIVDDVPQLGAGR